MISTLREWLYRIKHYPNLIDRFAEINEDLDMLKQDNDALQLNITELSNRNVELSIKLGNLTRKVDVNDAEFWNNKWVQSKIFYKAPNRKWVIDYVSDKNYNRVKKIAMDIILANSLRHNDIDCVALAVMKWVKKEKFKYAKEPSELWKCPEQILDDKDKGNDCDDIGILMYYICREIFKLMNRWEEVKHRLKAVAGNVNRRGSIPSSAGGHFYLTWLHSDGHWYTVESTYNLAMAIANYGKLPQKFNPMYGTIWFTFNEDYSWAQKSITISKNENHWRN